MGVRSISLTTVALAVAVGVVVVSSAPTSEVRAVSYPDGLVWLGLGDSYSSGEGLRYVDVDANPPGRTCERATGVSSVNDGQGSRAYAAVAYDAVRGEMNNSIFRLLACSGAITNEIRGQYEDEWLAEGEPKADLVTFSMGGNNIGFADVVFECIGVSVEGGVSAAIQGPYAMSLNPAIGCRTSEAELRRRIDMLVGNGLDERSAFNNSQTLPDLYREVAESAVNPGGHVIVLGYPNLVEESGRWTMGWLEGNRCSRIRRADTAMLRSTAGYLNEQIALAVEEADNAYRGVRFHWVDVSQVYESSDGRHGLCTEDPWINGITLGIAGPHSGDLGGRLMRSFHPNQKGHDATAAAVAAVVTGLDWTQLRRPNPELTSPASGFPFPSSFDVPQLGREPVRGSGCGSDGSIGTTIPDGWWFGGVEDIADSSIQLDLVCAYFGAEAVALVAECARDIGNDGYDDCTRYFGEQLWPVNNTIKYREVPLSPTAVREIEPGWSCSLSDVDEYRQDELTWVLIQSGEAAHLRHLCPGG